MNELYRLRGGAPQPLPVIVYAENGDAYTAPYADEDMAALDLVLADEKPYFDPATQIVVWDVEVGGWRVDDLPPSPEPLPPPVPAEIADWQFATILTEDGIISQAEAEDFCGAGVLPAALDAALDQIPDEAIRKRTRIKVRGAKTYVRTDPATMTLAAILGYNGDEIEDIWRRGAAVA